MPSEAEELSERLAGVLAAIGASLDGMSEAQLNWRPPLPGANSAFVIAAHTIGNARAWVLGIACGEDVSRDRPAEFRAAGAPDELAAALGQLQSDVARALRDLTSERLVERLLPAASLWGAGEPRAVSRREAVLRTIEHASTHLGHLQLTRDLALREAAP
jgi:hypothetical protein